MGERGPLPRPVVRRRNRRPQAGNTVTVQRPAMPRSLKGEARAEWRRVVPELEHMGLLTSVDRGVLIRYCVAWADWSELNAQLARSGRLVRGARGNLVRNPLWMMRSDAERTVTELARQLGLTPAARLRAGIRHELPEEPEARVSAIDEYRQQLRSRAGMVQ